MKRKWSLLLLTVANVILIGFFLLQYGHSFNLHRLLQEMSTIPSGLIILILAVNTALLFLYGCRLSYLIEERVPVGFGIAAVGYAANNLLPLRLGELARIYFAKKKYHVSAARSLLAMLCERVSDLFCIACLALIALLAAAGVFSVSRMLIPLGIISPLFLLLSLYLFKKMQLSQTIQQQRHYIGYIQPIFFELQNWFNLQKLWALLGYTLLIWIFTLSVFYLFFKYSLLVHFSLLDAICLTVCTSLSLAISTLPSGIGIFEAGIVYYLHAIKNVDETTALGLALVLHCLILLPQILCMCYFLSKPLLFWSRHEAR